MYILEQVISLMKWITQFDPQNVNVADLKYPKDLKHVSEFTSSLLTNFPKKNLMLKRGSEPRQIMHSFSKNLVTPNNHDRNLLPTQ